MSIPSTRFRVRKEKYTTPTLQAYITIYGTEAPKFSTQIKVDSCLKWNQKKQLFESNNVLAQTNNQILQEIKATVNECFIYMTRTNRVVTARTLKEDFLRAWRKDYKAITVFGLFNDFLELQNERDIEEKTLQKYYYAKDHLERYIKQKYRCQDLEIHQIDALFGYQFFDYLCKSVAEPTANRYLQLLRACLEHGIRNGKIKENPLMNTRPKVHHAKPNKTMISETEQLQLFRLDELTTTERHIADITTFMFYTTFDHCDYLEFRQEKHIVQSDSKRVIEKRRYKERKKQNPLICSIVVNNILDEILKRNPILPPYPEETVRRIYKNLCCRIGVKDSHRMGLKQIRKSGGTFYVNEDVPLKTVSEKILGHTSIAMTEKHYVKINNDTAIRHTKHLEER